MIARNTLISKAGINKIILMSRDEEVYTLLCEILIKFQEIKTFASEIHTETHLIKPILKLLGYAYESKPKFFEEQIKGPDAALFLSDEERVKSSSLWGTQDYYSNALGILLLKRYGRNLEEGISGFYLEFENRIPVFQTVYLLRKTKTPWGILTDGKYWLLIGKPVSYESRLIGIDLENALLENGRETLNLFFNIFSLDGLTKTLPDIMEQERVGLIDILKEKKIFVRNAILGLKKKIDILPKVIDIYKELYSDSELAATEIYLRENNVTLEKKNYTQPSNISDYNISNIAAYLFNKKGYKTSLNLEDVFFNNRTGELTKEDILSLKILDMTPNFGNIATDLIDGIAYLSFILPYKERNTFVAEWENQTSLQRYIISNILFGIEKSYFAYDIFHEMMKKRFKTEAKNYKFGNPLIGMSFSDVPHHFDSKNQLDLFSKNPLNFLNTFRNTFNHYLSLSEKIREDAQIREELDIILQHNTGRIRDAFDIITATYFGKTIDNKKINDLLFSLDSDESTWNNLSSQNWFISSKDIARKNGFFHFELEFPFLLDGAFDFIFVQPALQHVWEDAFPIGEATKAYIKRGMPYLKNEGSMVVILEERFEDVLVQELSQSKRYTLEMKKDLMLLHKKKGGNL